MASTAQQQYTCAAHQKQNKEETQRKYDRYERNTETRALYGSTRWRRLRQLKLDISPLCSCGSVATIVHHIRAADSTPELFWCLDNLESICATCHNVTHKARQEDF